jgi:NAD(P)-dependent dehydrogenase (short-subunit alcohol dehydrogenase family)
MAINRFSLAGKVALVTGGGRGIGRAIAMAFADAGADVAVTSRTSAELEEAAGEIRAKGRRSLPVRADIAKSSDLKRLVERAKKDLGRIDVLVNNAGYNVPPPGYELMDAGEDIWDAIMNVDLKGAFLLSQLVARTMREQGGGSIVNISSLAGLVPWSKLYSVAKAGLVMLTQVMAKDWGRYHIRVNNIAPGLIKTKFAEPLWKEPAWAEVMAKNRALVGYIGEPDEMTGAALFFASDASSYVTGTTLVVDGGEYIGPPLSIGDLLDTRSPGK